MAHSDMALLQLRPAKSITLSVVDVTTGCGHFLINNRANNSVDQEVFQGKMRDQGSILTIKNFDRHHRQKYTGHIAVTAS